MSGVRRETASTHMEYLTATTLKVSLWLDNACMFGQLSIYIYIYIYIAIVHDICHILSIYICGGFRCTHGVML